MYLNISSLIKLTKILGLIETIVVFEYFSNVETPLINVGINRNNSCIWIIGALMTAFYTVTINRNNSCIWIKWNWGV